MRRLEPEGHERRTECDLGRQSLEPREEASAGESAGEAALSQVLQQELERREPDGEPELPEGEAPGRRKPQLCPRRGQREALLRRREEGLEEAPVLERFP